MTAPPGPRARPDALPLSSAQQKIWVFSQLNPELPIFNTFRAYRIRGPLRLDLLARGLDEIAARHETLRTTYPAVDGGPRPMIAGKPCVTLEISDRRGLFASGSQAALTDFCNERIGRPIDLADGPIFRAEAVRTAEDEHLLIMVSHQIVFDGASWSNLNGELTALYDAYRSGSPSRPRALPLQYVDFTLWQRDYLRSGALAELSAYWREQLGGGLPVLRLPTRGDSSAHAYNEGHSLPFTLTGELTADLQALGKREGVTLFVLLLSVFQLLLRQFADQQDLVVFTSVPCRTRPEFRQLIGLFSNFIPLRTRLGENPAFTDLLHDVQENYSGALGHQDLPFESIMREVQSGEESIDESLFQTLFVFENAAKKTLAFEGCELTPLELKTGFTKFDITLFMEERHGELSGSLRYKPGKFDAGLIAAMVSRFDTLLREVASRPEGRIDDLPGLSPAERSLLPAAQNDAGPASPLAAGEPAPGAGLPSPASSRMPQTRIETLIAETWKEVLGRDRIGIHDNFFDLGGNSHLLVLLIGRLQKKLGREISIVEIFRDPTISAFARRLGDQRNGGASYDHVHERAARKRRALAGRRNTRGRQA